MNVDNRLLWSVDKKSDTFSETGRLLNIVFHDGRRTLLRCWYIHVIVRTVAAAVPAAGACSVCVCKHICMCICENL